VIRSSVFVTVLAFVFGALLSVDSTQAQPAVFGKASQGRVPGAGPKKGGPRIGDKAPDFELKFLNSEKMFKLSENLDKRPTVLVFHSFT